ncbi:MAG TPA: LysR family transcriptional regulator [Polyangiaceae bacterium]|nr:LysR family transcriptional regulator [Polyangiaceae bacterium]
MDFLAQIATFRRVVEAGSFSAATRGLGMSVAAVSRQISALEAELGAPLLMRTSRKLSMTDQGQRFYDYCVRLTQLTDEARASVREGAELRGALTVTAPVALGLERVGPALYSFSAQHPGVELELRLEERTVDLVAEGVHVAVRAAPAPPPSALLVATPLTRSARLVVASPDYLRARGEPKAPAALAGHDALVHVTDAGPASDWRFRRGGEEHTIKAGGPFRATTLLALRDAALGGLGLALLPEWLVRDALAEGRLRAVLAGYEVPPISVFALYRVDLRHVARVRALLEHLRAAFAEPKQAAAPGPPGAPRRRGPPPGRARSTKRPPPGGGLP